MIKLFEQFNNEQEIIDICEKYNIKNYTINSDGSIDVDGDVNLSIYGLTKLPLKFNNIYGNFNCHNNNLTNLLGSPNYVYGNFHCHKNNLTSLKGGPDYVDGSFYCTFNKLTSLVGSPNIVNLTFKCFNNPLNIIGTSIHVKGEIEIKNTNFDGKIKNLSQEKLRILFEHGVDYVVFRKDGTINDSRLERLFKDFNI